MRIIHVHKYFHRRDGASRFEQDLMRLQEEAGYVVAPFAMHEPRNDLTPWAKYFVSPLETRTIARGTGALRQMSRAWWSREAEQKMGKLLDVFRPDVVHAHNLYTHLSPSPLAACKARGIPVVMHVHDYALVSANYGLWDGKNVLPPDASLARQASSRFIKGSIAATAAMELLVRAQRTLRRWDGAIAQYVVPSTFVRDALVAVGYSSSKIEVIPHFVLPTHGKAVRREDFVLFVGRLENYKGPQVLIEAMKKLPGVALKIAGTGPIEIELRAMAKKMDNVDFLGFQPAEEVAQLMRRARAVVVPSIWAEPFGLVAIEAMQEGAPVIVSDMGGLPEIVKDGESGLVVRAGDAKQLARALNELIDDPKAANALGEAGRKRVQSLSSPQAYLAKMTDLYSKWNEEVSTGKMR